MIKNFFILKDDIVILHGSKKLTTTLDFNDWLSLCHYRWYMRTYTKRPGLVYTLTTIKDQKVYLHTAIMGAKIIDHINQNSLDNRRVNLRQVTYAQNTANGRKRKDNKSGYKGVFWNTQHKCWHTKMSVEYKNVHIGYFKDVYAAKMAYDAAYNEWYGRTHG